MGAIADQIGFLTRAGPARCARCCYDTASIETDRCPECGERFDPAWRSASPAAGSVLRRKAPVVVALSVAVQTVLGLAVVVGLCQVMAAYAPYGAVTTRNVAAAAIAAALTCVGITAVGAVVTHRHRIAHGPVAWFWIAVAAPWVILVMGLIAWGLGELFLPAS